uniref:Leucine rich repeat containing 43 n=1 Tax=Pelodiscus sinensis TaxID=13735 RepID=K7G5R1_PELSI
NRSRFKLRKRKPGGNAVQREEEEIETPNEESPQTLMEFVSSQDSPWALPPDCSPEDQHLRELAVQSPQLIRDNFIFLFYRSLRIVDRGVNEVDEHLLKFHNLEELVLSANQISKINSAHLPRTLKVLELCGNEIVGLQDLCSHPPPKLQHLGLGYNRLLGSSEDKYLTADFWPNLLSLDLSFNNFTDLLGIVAKLDTLQQLRMLVLQGNPLVLMPGYRGFVIDSLPKLCILDDRNISPDEKHKFHGLSSKPDLIVNKAQLVVSVGKIKGVPNPIKPEELESSPEFPLITYSYYVTYEFVERENAEDTNSAEYEHHTDCVLQNKCRVQSWICFVHAAPTEVSECSLQGVIYWIQSHKAESQGGSHRWQELQKRNHPVKSQKGRLMQDFGGSQSLARVHITNKNIHNVASWSCGGISPEQASEKSGGEVILPSAGTANKHLTIRKSWAETMDCNHRKEHITGDLVELKAFLMAGTTITVVEEKVLSWPVAAAQTEDAGKKGKAEKGKADKGKAEKGKPKDGGKGDKQKKKKESPIELRSDPPFLRSLGSGNVNLESLLTGDQLVAVVCDFGILITEETTQPSSPKDSKKSKDKNKKTKTEGESPTNQKTTV